MVAFRDAAFIDDGRSSVYHIAFCLAIILGRGPMGNAQSGLLQVRLFGTVTRRGFIAGSGALAGYALVGADQAHAATTITFVGWQGYDTPLSDYAKANGIVIDATYIGDSNQIISKLTSGGVGTVDIVTPNATYVPLLVKLDTLS